ncbi:MAG: hypothetical protein HY876_01750 [Coriobacteriales bacterium]|nr:hypothetical protein [Coriobacteriales bacterium]
MNTRQPMSTRQSVVVAVAITVIAVIGAFALGAMKLADAPDLRGESSTRGRALAIESEVAAEAQKALGEGWVVRAKLVGLKRYRGNFGASGWEADYGLVITSKDVPDFQQTTTVTRAFGPGAGRVDENPLPMPRVFGPLLELPEDRQAAFLMAFVQDAPDAQLEAIIPLKEAMSSSSARSRRTTRDFARLTKGRGGDADNALIGVVSSEPRTIVWDFEVFDYLPLGTIDEDTGAIRKWRPNTSGWRQRMTRSWVPMVPDDTSGSASPSP